MGSCKTKNRNKYIKNKTKKQKKKIDKMGSCKTKSSDNFTSILLTFFHFQPLEIFTWDFHSTLIFTLFHRENLDYLRFSPDFHSTLIFTSFHPPEIFIFLQLASPTWDFHRIFIRYFHFLANSLARLFASLPIWDFTAFLNDKWTLFWSPNHWGVIKNQKETLCI